MHILCVALTEDKRMERKWFLVYDYYEGTRTVEIINTCHGCYWDKLFYGVTWLTARGCEDW